MAQVTVRKRGKGINPFIKESAIFKAHLTWTHLAVAANELAASEPLSSKNLDVLD
jgi:hypothetical protein